MIDNPNPPVKNIVLIGFMGTGKTTIATALANRLGLRYVSTDNLIENREKRTINEIFREEGEERFRDIETEVVREISGLEGLVIDTGGGIVLREENMKMLKSCGVVICLTAGADMIMERTRKYKHRPLLNVDDPKLRIRSLLAKRAPYYSAADHTVDTGKLTARQAVERIIEITGAGKT